MECRAWGTLIFGNVVIIATLSGQTEAGGRMSVYFPWLRVSTSHSGLLAPIENTNSNPYHNPIGKTEESPAGARRTYSQSSQQRQAHRHGGVDYKRKLKATEKNTRETLREGRSRIHRTSPVIDLQPSSVSKLFHPMRKTRQYKQYSTKRAWHATSRSWQCPAVPREAEGPVPTWCNHPELPVQAGFFSGAKTVHLGSLTARYCTTLFRASSSFKTTSKHTSRHRLISPFRAKDVLSGEQYTRSCPPAARLTPSNIRCHTFQHPNVHPCIPECPSKDSTESPDSQTLPRLFPRIPRQGITFST
ncbi:hypothetical protein CRG98_021777 [Punica granatum]|uniref:Secreted protein n=1 Tax=Punica granatum TaxID=22663 RepID=A0A2I0JNK2_PUNGR|nr:hypothetical protein CRG98_021777 [Punica granatum]